MVSAFSNRIILPWSALRFDLNPIENREKFTITRRPAAENVAELEEGIKSAWLNIQNKTFIRYWIVQINKSNQI